MVINRYQVEQPRMDIHIEYEKIHNQLYQVLDQTYNYNEKLYYLSLSFRFFLQQLGA